MSHEDALMMTAAIQSIATACGGITVSIILCTFASAFVRLFIYRASEK